MTALQEMPSVMACPLCGGTTFEAVKNRPNARCTGCRSLVRGRSTWLLLEHVCKIGPTHRIAHFAPERAIAAKLMPLCEANYETYDFAPDLYGFAKARACNLCTDLEKFEKSAYDVVIHNHILEHLPCNYTVVLQGLHALLKPGGHHIFSVPLLAGYSASNLNPKLGREERHKRFGQFDHLRRFGKEDFHMELGPVLGITRDYDLSNHVPAAVLCAANVPPPNWRAQAAGTVFVVRKS